MSPPASNLAVPFERNGGSFSHHPGSSSKRESYAPYLTDRSINDSPIPVKTIGSVEGEDFGRRARLPSEPRQALCFGDVTHRGSGGRRRSAHAELWRPCWPGGRSRELRATATKIESRAWNSLTVRLKMKRWETIHASILNRPSQPLRS